MVTPLLESSNMDTPFLDSFSADTPPFFDTALDVSPYLMYASFADTHQQNNNSKDVFIAGYLDGHENSDIAKLTHDPLKFNGDPSVLLIDKSKSPHLSYPSPAAAEPKPSPTVKLETVTEEDSDSLFPPLNSSQQSMNTDTQSSQDVSLDQLLGFDPSSPLSEDDSDDYVKGAITVKESKSAKLFQCPLCPHMSKRRYNLSTHMKTHDKNRIKEFNCLHEGCKKSFDRRHDRDRHLATVHRGERSYNCSECKSHFSRRDALNRHLVQKHDYDEQDFAE
ncbi:C2H2-type zinc finger transcription factor [Mucor lusitanicus]|uniref:C2H2-type zinc finger transcription factor n=1 Tax=Mucor circinelloides f. lusitanicus TaxID=29924 RepID=A0A8H4B6P2_MUCCL|nr:C2H2-type zinc finger transcription factor [Mucor lusitanicus]